MSRDQLRMHDLGFAWAHVFLGDLNDRRLDERVVQPQVLTRHVGPEEALAHATLRFLAHALERVRIDGKEADGDRQLADVAWLDQESRAPVVDELRQSGYATRKDRGGAGHSLERDER